MKKRGRIRFDMDDISDITDELVEVKEDFYTILTTSACGSLRFAIPQSIRIDLNLKAGDICYFCQYADRTFLYFGEGHCPLSAIEKQTKTRKLASAGSGNTLYLAIPPMFKNQYHKPISGVSLTKMKGYKPHEWQIQFLFTDFT